MDRFAIVGACCLALGTASGAIAQDVPEFPTPQKEHEWLQQFVGEWKSEGELMPGTENAMSFETKSQTRAIGGFWIVSVGEAEFAGMPFRSVLTLGYDASRKKYVGTWIDSLSPAQRKYEGIVSADGKVLTLESEIPDPRRGGALTKYKEIYEFKSKDHFVIQSMMKNPDDTWMTFVTIQSRRKT